jgi:sulfonate transport system permease protein
MPLRLLPLLRKRLPFLMPPILLWAAWEAAILSGAFPATILIPPAQVFATLWSLIQDGELASDLGVTAGRVLSGFAIGGGTGLVVGVFLALVPAAERQLGGLFHAGRQVPFIALGPLFIVMFGIGEAFIIAMIAVAAFFPVALNTLDGIRGVPRRYRDVAMIYGFSRWSLIRRVVLPGALPAILTGLRLALARCWGIVVAAELFGSNAGIGHMMEWAREMFQIDVVMAGVVVTGVIGFLMDQGLRRIEARLVPWQGRGA